MKKLNKLFAILVAMAMVLSLTAISAFAATPVTSDVAGTGVKTKVTKNLNKNDSTTNPTNITYKFLVEDKETDTSKKMSDQTVSMSSTDFTIADVLAGFISEFPEAGKYSFKVTEVAPAVADGYTSVNGRVGEKSIL